MVTWNRRSRADAASDARGRATLLPGLLFFAMVLAAAGLLGCGDDDGGQNQNGNANQNNQSQPDAAVTDAGPADAGPGDAGAPDGGGGGDCTSMCTLLLTCPDVPDRDLLFGTSQQACEAACTGTVEPYLRDCMIAATGCGQLGECTRCLTWNDIGFCRDPVCDFLVGECGGSDVSQCYIDCEMYGSGAAGCFRGAGRSCWVQAANAHDCTAATACPTIH